MVVMVVIAPAFPRIGGVGGVGGATVDGGVPMFPVPSAQFRVPSFTTVHIY
jgi:hypothetical protein